MSGRTYEAAPAETLAFIRQVMRDYHPSLDQAGVTVGAVFAYGPRDDENDDEITGPAIKHRGFPALATIKITSLKERAMGLPDAYITIDGDQWSAFNEARRVALIDHELEHLEPVGKTDDLNRPRLEMREHDFMLTGFLSVAKRHGSMSFEQHYASDLVAAYEQELFPWMKEQKSPQNSR